MKQIISGWIRFFTLILLIVPVHEMVSQAIPGQENAYQAEIQAWHARRLASLQQPVGWLSLVALDWLKEGENLIEAIGTVSLEKDVLTFKALPNVTATVQGKVFTAGVLKAGSDRVEVGSRVFTIIKRGDRYAIRMWDTTAAALKHFAGINRFPVSEQWRIEARWEAYDAPKPIKVASVIPGYMEDYTVPGVAIFSVNGKEYRLEPVTSGSNSLFFIFADETNGTETYGAGRFLYSDLPKNGTVVIDFNKAINPPCAFSPYATCPLPPESNQLSLRVEAGELNYGQH